MSGASLNYHHLHYFWVVATEGSVTKAAARLGVAVQTISGQLAQLERDLGAVLLAPQGRGLVLTEAGRLVLGYADRIFQIGDELHAALQMHGESKTLRLTVGIADALPKLATARLLQPALQLAESVRLVCFEGEFDELMADLALHKLDVVLADRPWNASTRLRVFSHPLGEYEISLFAAPALAAQYRVDFPASLNGAPLLLPTRNTALRLHLDHWLEARNLRPKVAGEFEDNALLNTFGRSGLGLFPAPTVLSGEVQQQLQAEVVGSLPGVCEQFFAIS
ncbi:MAG TPA: LysR family transcriptional regulator, partial [Rhodocyclaceae bacterium]|nr:LysR family transcriptional regulator [Rhodocyclaceae bacterium]